MPQVGPRPQECGQEYPLEVPRNAHRQQSTIQVSVDLVVMQVCRQKAQLQCTRQAKIDAGTNISQPPQQRSASHWHMQPHDPSYLTVISTVPPKWKDSLSPMNYGSIYHSGGNTSLGRMQTAKVNAAYARGGGGCRGGAVHETCGLPAVLAIQETPGQCMWPAVSHTYIVDQHMPPKVYMSLKSSK